MMTIDPMKDVDGFHPVNMGALLLGSERLVPCTPKGIVHALSKLGVKLEGAEAVIVGHSNVVGKPLCAMLLNRNATVTVCHVYTKELSMHTKKADILIVAAGVPGLIKADMVKDGACVFDVGINRVKDKTVGDVDFDGVSKKAGAITPVPGGVGPLTVSMLLRQTSSAAAARIEQKEGPG
jgi:methylenetetrahydrofolate dehydrogenase (NADP+)/methenyltetrahydrofolate cyclohydrolase